MDCSVPHFPLHHHLPEFAQTHVHWVSDTIHLILCHPLLFLPSSFTASGSFPKSWLFTSGGQNIGASASVLPMSIQGWFPLGLTGLILLSKAFGISQVLPLTEVHHTPTVNNLHLGTLTLSFLLEVGSPTVAHWGQALYFITFVLLCSPF